MSSTVVTASGNEGAIFRTEANAEYGLTVAFEDDGRVAYGYLLDTSRQIVADVWLYNRAAAPAAPVWRDKAALPFLNPQQYVRRQTNVAMAAVAADVGFRWHANADLTVIVEIFLQGRLAGRIWPGAKPGWAAGALDGPLAKGTDGDSLEA